MCKDLISVIVPIYNVEKYLDKCVESIVNQTYRDLEIILVDDGSPDNCPAMCDEWAKKDGRIKVIHKENGGLSSARNAGLDIVSGEFVAFVDSDDWVDANLIEHLYNTAESGGHALACCGIIKEFGTETEQLVDSIEYKACNQKELFNLILDTDYVCGYACNKLFRRDVIGDLRFDESLMSCEDIDFCSRFAAKCEGAAYTKTPLYHYRQRNDSMTGDYSYNERKLSVIKAYENIMPLYAQYDADDYYKLERNYLKINLNVKGRMIVSGIDNDTLLRRLNNNIEKYYPIVMRNKNNGLKTKLNIALTKMFPSLLLRIKQFVLSKMRGLKDD